MSSWISVADRLPTTTEDDPHSDDVITLALSGGKLFVRDGWYVNPLGMWMPPKHATVIAWQAYPEGEELARLVEKADEGGAR